MARITVTAREGWNDQKHARIDDRMAFGPWHGLAAHRPLGAIMRVRKSIYEAATRFRAEANGAILTDPDPAGALE